MKKIINRGVGSVVCGLHIILAPVAAGEVKLARIFTDQMVLQQQMPIRVWGSAGVDEAVAVEFNGKTATTKADADGRWRVELPAMEADGRAHTLTVKGENTLALQDVLLGEVWIAAGQSNMNREVPIKEDHPAVRLFWIHGSTVPREEDLGDNAMGWEPATATRTEALRSIREERFGRGRKEGYAEVGWVFGLRVREQLKVPVGLIKIAFGGSQAQAWTPVPNIAEEFPYDQKVEGSYLGHKPGLLYQSMLHGLGPLGVRGVVWYQGENNGRGWDYDQELGAMISSWRRVFEQPTLPFYLAQIAQTTYASGMLRVWECQAKVAAGDPQVHLGMSVNLYDTLKPGSGNGVRPHDGNEKNPGTGWPIAGGSNPHPPNKQIVADRLADLALVHTYGLDLKREVAAPVYDSHLAKDGKLLVKFKHVGEGLKTDDGAAPVWFEISDGTKKAENDRAPLVYHKAAARIVGKDTVELSSPEVAAPVHVRLAWFMLARQNLQNSSGLPAVNFRTDTQATKDR